MLDAAEQRLYDELEKLCRGRAVTLTPGMRLVDALGKQIRQFSAEERELALRLRFTCAVLDRKNLRTLALVDLEWDGEVPEREQKTLLCQKTGIRYLCVRDGQWEGLRQLIQELP